MSGRGRPSLGTAVQIRIPSDVLDVLDERARAAKVSRAEIVRRVLAEWVKQ